MGLIRQVVLFVAALALLAGVPARADDRPDTPATLAGAKVVSVAEAHALLRAGGVLFIDTRNPLNFGKGRVPGARLAYYDEKSSYAPNFDGTLDKFEWERLPADKNMPLVFYSHGLNGWKSYKAAALAVGRGYTQVHYLREGWAGWQAARLPVEQ